MAHLNAKYSFKKDINTCYISPLFIGSMLNYLIVYFMFRGTVSTRSSVLDAPDPSPLTTPTHNHETGTMHPQTLPGACSQRSSSLQIRGQRRLFSFSSFPSWLSQARIFQGQGSAAQDSVGIFMFPALCTVS